MKLQQLRYIWEVAQHDMNVSATAAKLFTSQPGISKQIRLLEEELGVDIFVRSGKQFTGLTPAGQEILKIAGDILAKSRAIREIADEFHNKAIGTLSIATTHTQARYALPLVVQQFMQRYPDIRLTINQGTPAQIAELVSRGAVDLAIATEGTDLFDNLVKLPCYQWNRSILVPHGHPLTKEKNINLEHLVNFPIITYTFGFTGRSELDRAFEKAGLHPHLSLTAVDADVIKTYVRLGLGIGIVAHMAYDPAVDSDLTAIEAGHLFAPSTTKLVLRRDMFLRTFLYDFIHMLAPHLDRDTVDQAMTIREKKDWDHLFRELKLPVH
ncbi:MAG: HTH-type transcriptional regulator CysB [Methylococcaceae bacterium]